MTVFRYQFFLLGCFGYVRCGFRIFAVAPVVDMQIANNKLVDRAVKIIMKEKNIDYDTANGLLEKYGSVRNVILNYE